MEVILPQRLVRKRKGEDTTGHASSSQTLSTLPVMHWQAQVEQVPVQWGES